MHAHRIANRRKCRRMNLFCASFPVAPTGARKGHISILLYFCTAKNRTTPRGRSQSIGKPHGVSRPQTRKMFDPFSAATCAWQKTLCAGERRIVRCQRTTEAQSAANLSRKSGFATFFGNQNDPEGSFSVALIVDAHHAADRGAADARRPLAVPAPTGLTVPALTVTTEVSSLDHVTAASVPRKNELNGIAHSGSMQSSGRCRRFFSVVPTFVPTVSAAGSTVGVSGSGSTTGRGARRA